MPAANNPDFVPGRVAPFWLRVDYQTLLSNISQQANHARLIELTTPLLQKIWPEIEDDLMRCGLNGVLSTLPEALLKVSSALNRILKPGFKHGACGYAAAGLLPVLGSYSECLNLSNMAQQLDKRLSFLLRARAPFGESGAGDWCLESICEQLDNIPMIDLLGFFMSRQPESGEISTMRRILRRLENSEPLLLVPLSCTSGDCHELRPFITWEPFALEGNAPGCFPVETGFWAFPVKTGSDYQIFQADIGMLHGLPNHDFPVKIAGRNARVCNLHTDFCEFLVNGHLPGPFPVMGFLTGGDTHAPVDLQNWKPADLKNLLAHLDHCPLYLQKNNQIIEFPA